MSDPKSGARPHASVTLADFATVTVGLDDGLGLDELLRFVGIPEAAWPMARAGWEARVVEDLSRGGELAAELERAKIRALARWTRRIEPLDRDLRAYLDFERTMGEQIDREAFLASLGLNRADSLRLQGIWAERLRDPAVRSEALGILNEPPRALPPIETSAARLGNEEGENWE